MVKGFQSLDLIQVHVHGNRRFKVWTLYRYMFMVVGVSKF